MRLEEIAKQMARASTDIWINFDGIRELETKAAHLKTLITKSQKKLDELIVLQTQLLECQTYSEFGIPTGISKEEFEKITEHQITS